MKILRHGLVYILLLFVSTLAQTFFDTDWGPFRFVSNPGFIFGTLSTASVFIRVALTTLILVPVTLISLYLYANLAPELKRLRWGLTFLLAGILGNGMEKIVWGHVVDYWHIGLGSLGHFSFNLNDASQILGLLIIIRELFVHQDVIWFPAMRRRSVFVYPEIQIPALLRILLGVFLGSLFQLLLAVVLLFPNASGEMATSVKTYLVSLGVLSIFFYPILGLLILREFLRCLGPVASLEHYLENAEPHKPLKFRKSHHFASLEIAFNRFREELLKGSRD